MLHLLYRIEMGIYLMDSHKIRVLKESLDKALEELNVNLEFERNCTPRPELEDYIHEVGKQVFYVLSEFEDAILKALKD